MKIKANPLLDEGFTVRQAGRWLLYIALVVPDAAVFGPLYAIEKLRWPKRTGEPSALARSSKGPPPLFWNRFCLRRQVRLKIEELERNPPTEEESQEMAV